MLCAFTAQYSPILRFSNVYGIDMPSPSELVAYGRNEEQIAKAIGADLVIFQTLPDLIASVQQFNSELKAFDCSVFTGEYVTGGVDREYLHHIDQLRSDSAKEKVASTVNGVSHQKSDADLAGLICNGRMNGVDETVGLHNSWIATSIRELANRTIVS